jgi:hypothetical protein
MGISLPFCCASIGSRTGAADWNGRRSASCSSSSWQPPPAGRGHHAWTLPQHLCPMRAAERGYRASAQRFAAATLHSLDPLALGVRGTTDGVVDRSADGKRARLCVRAARRGGGCAGSTQPGRGAGERVCAKRTRQRAGTGQVPGVGQVSLPDEVAPLQPFGPLGGGKGGRYPIGRGEDDWVR